MLRSWMVPVPVLKEEGERARALQIARESTTELCRVVAAGVLRATNTLATPDSSLRHWIYWTLALQSIVGSASPNCEADVQSNFWIGKAQTQVRGTEERLAESRTSAKCRGC